MATHTIEISETTYQQILDHAKHLQLSPQDMVEQLLLSGLGLPMSDAHESDLEAGPQVADSTAALAAVERLSTLFADLPIPSLDQHLSDPMLALANSTIESLIL